MNNKGWWKLPRQDHKKHQERCLQATLHHTSNHIKFTKLSENRESYHSNFGMMIGIKKQSLSSVAFSNPFFLKKSQILLFIIAFDNFERNIVLQHCSFLNCTIGHGFHLKASILWSLLVLEMEHIVQCPLSCMDFNSQTCSIL